MIPIIIDKRFNGPPNSGNGGYAAGIMATNLSFSPEVTLRAPLPLDKPMDLLVKEDAATLLDGETLIAEAKVTDFQLNIITPVSFEQVSLAAASSNVYESSPFQKCFVCGADRAVGDGLNIRPRIIGSKKVAAPWVPYANLGNKDGIVKEAFIWSALDCPGAWAMQDEKHFYLLGRMATKIIKPVMVGNEYVIMGWVIATERRKTWTGTAIYDEKGKVCAYAKGTWILVK